MGKKQHKTRKKRSIQKQQPKRRHNGPGRRVPPSVMARLEQQWPFHEILINENWREFGQLAQILVSRREKETGDLVTGVFLVDLCCLGIKNGFLSFLDPREYGQLVEDMRETHSMVACEPDLAAKILLSGIEYADNLGFKPNGDAAQAFPVLLGAKASACDETVTLGDGKGKPFYISGPHDNVKRIMAILDRKVGREGYEFIVGEPAEGLFDEEVIADLDET